MIKYDLKTRTQIKYKFKTDTKFFQAYEYLQLAEEKEHDVLCHFDKGEKTYSFFLEFVQQQAVITLSLERRKDDDGYLFTLSTVQEILVSSIVK